MACVFLDFCDSICTLDTKIVSVDLYCSPCFFLAQQHARGDRMALTLDDIKQRIQQRGYSWEAGETSVSILDDETTYKLFGLKPTGACRVSAKTAGKGKKAKVALDTTSLDWRERFPDPSLWQVKNQDTCGSCVSFAVLAAMESALVIHGKAPSGIDLSEADLFYCGGGSCDDGWEITSALTHAREWGVTEEQCFPYSPTPTPCMNHCDDWEEQIYKIKKFKDLCSRDKMKEHLLKAPLVGGMLVYSDFLYYRSGVYKPVSRKELGKHAICIVGFNDEATPGHWICKNSWGHEWGENGYFRVGYGVCKIDTEYPMYSIHL